MRHTKILIIATMFLMFTIFSTTAAVNPPVYMHISANEITTDKLTIHFSELPPYQSYYLNWTGHEALWEFEYSPQNISEGTDIEVEFEVPDDAFYMNFYLYSGVDGSYLDETSVIVSQDYSKGGGINFFGWWDADLLIPLALVSVVAVIGYSILWFLRRGH